MHAFLKLVTICSVHYKRPHLLSLIDPVLAVYTLSLKYNLLSSISQYETTDKQKARNKSMSFVIEQEENSVIRTTSLLQLRGRVSRTQSSVCNPICRLLVDFMRNSLI